MSLAFQWKCLWHRANCRPAYHLDNSASNFMCHILSLRSQHFLYCPHTFETGGIYGICPLKNRCFLSEPSQYLPVKRKKQRIFRPLLQPSFQSVRLRWGDLPLILPRWQYWAVRRPRLIVNQFVQYHFLRLAADVVHQSEPLHRCFLFQLLRHALLGCELLRQKLQPL